MQPGDTANPGNTSEPPKEPAQEPDQAGPATRTQTQETPSDAAWSYSNKDTDSDGGAVTTAAPSAPVSWSASEYIAHKKGASWFVMVMAVVLVVTVAFYFLTDDYATPIAVFMIGVAFAVLGGRPPQVLDYSVDGTGVHIGQRFYPYVQFKSFSILEEDAVHSILLMPLQRLGLPITVHYEQIDEEKIVQVIGSHLPHEEREVAAIDRLMSKIHF